MNKYILIALIITGFYCRTNAQVFITQSAKVSFFSTTPMENIDAVNSKVSSLINTSTDSVLVKIKNTAFVFKNSLMQDHFNENYMESSKFPFASFRGKINEDIDYKKNGSYKVTATGKMLIHGVAKNVTLNGLLTVKDQQISLNSEFPVKLSDYKIDVPKLVFEKIAETLKVNLAATYTHLAK